MSKLITAQLTDMLIAHCIAHESTSRDSGDYRLLLLLVEFAEKNFPAWSKKNRTIEYKSIIVDAAAHLSARWIISPSDPNLAKPKTKRQRYYNHSHNCEECGVLFDSSRYDAQYCSPKCRKAKAQKRRDFEQTSAALIALTENFWSLYRESVEFNPTETLKRVANIANSYLKEH